MKISMRGYGCALAIFIGAASAIPAQAADHKNILSEQARSIDGGRAVQVVISQAEIKSNINQSNIVLATGGGLLGALIDAGINAERAKKAEAAIQPLRAALTGYDVDALALETTKGSLEKVSWFQAPAANFSRDSSILGMSGVLDAATAPQVVFVEYIYDTSPDFSSIRVSMNVRIANKLAPAGKTPESRFQTRQLAYAQTLTSVVSLPSASKDAAANAELWSANGGALARKALAAGFGEVGSLLPRAMGLQEADLKILDARDKKYVVRGGYSGRIQDEGPEGALLYNGSLVHVQTISN
jgi:hypothetical protein